MRKSLLPTIHFSYMNLSMILLFKKKMGRSTTFTLTSASLPINPKVYLKISVQKAWLEHCKTPISHVIFLLQFIPNTEALTGLRYTVLSIKHNIYLLRAAATTQYQESVLHYLPLPPVKHWLAQKFIQLHEDGEQTCVSARTRHQKDVFAL